VGLEEIVKALLIYGPLGLFCAVLLLGYIQKDRAMAAMQKDFLDKQEALMQQHKREMQALEERYITKAETWMEKYRERADALEDLDQVREEEIDKLTERITGLEANQKLRKGG
jgi:predicted Holliday junction resolvase-like endonuclease